MRKTEAKIKKAFGDRLRSIRRNQELSQEVLADLCDLDRSYIGSVERGERNISLLNIHRICSALNISLEEFFHGVRL
jgi:transcriptional regulator with XRE-family HTH domain